MAEVIATFEANARARSRGDDGLFTGSLSTASDEAAWKTAHKIADDAGARCWSESKPITANAAGGEAEVIASGPKAALEHEGSPPHNISGGVGPRHKYEEGHTVMANEGAPGRGPHRDYFYAWDSVRHPGFGGDHFLEVAGDASYGYGLEVLIALLP